MTEAENINLEQEVRELNIRKAEVLIGKLYHGAMIGIAIGGSATLASSIPITVLDVLPRWSEIAMITGGALTGPSAVFETNRTRRWLEAAKNRFMSQKTKVERLTADWQEYNL